MTTCDAILCIDAGGTYFKSGVFSADGTQVDEVFSVSVNQAGTMEEILACYLQIVEHFQKKHRLTAISVATPGPFDYQNGISLMQHKFPALYREPLGDRLRAASGLSVPIGFLSDTHAFLLGASERSDNCLGVTIGTGVGLAVIQNGTLQTNPHGGPIEVIYNRPMRDGILEDIVSGHGIAAAYEKRCQKRCTAKEIGDAAEAGEADALAVYRDLGDCLGSVLAPIVRKYRADTVVFGGQISASLPVFEAELRRHLGEQIRLIREHGLQTALIGACRAAMKQNIPRETRQRSLSGNKCSDYGK